MQSEVLEMVALLSNDFSFDLPYRASCQLGNNSPFLLLALALAVVLELEHPWSTFFPWAFISKIIFFPSSLG